MAFKISITFSNFPEIVRTLTFTSWTPISETNEHVQCKLDRVVIALFIRILDTELLSEGFDCVSEVV